MSFVLRIFFKNGAFAAIAFLFGASIAFSDNQNFFDQNLVVFLDVIDWENNQAMKNARIQIMNPQGNILATHQNPRFKLTDAVAFTPNCIWIGMAGYNPIARAEPQLPLSTYQSISCIDPKTNKATDFYVPGIAAGTPTPTTDGNAVIFSSSAKPVVILARDDKSIQVLDLATIDPKIDVALKTAYNHAHLNGFYFQTVEMGVGHSAIIKLNESTLVPSGILHLPNSFTPILIPMNNNLVAIQVTDRSIATNLLVIDTNLRIQKKLTTGLGCLNSSMILGTRNGQIYGLKRNTAELFSFDLKKCVVLAKLTQMPYRGALKKDMIYFATTNGQKKIPAYNLNTRTWKYFDAGQSIEWVQ